MRSTPAARIAISVLSIVDSTCTSPRKKSSAPAITRKARSSQAIIGSTLEGRHLARRQLRHYAPALGTGHGRPAGDLIDRAPAAETQAARAIDLADVDTGALHSAPARNTAGRLCSL